MARNRDDRDDDDDDDRPRRRRPSDEDEEEDRPRARRRSPDEDDDDRPTRRRRRTEEPKSSGGKTAIIVISIIGGLFLVCGGAAFAVYWFTLKPAFDKVKESFDNAKNNLNSTQGATRIGLGLHTSESVEGQFPLPYVFDKSTAQPWKSPTDLSSRLSWRVALLPYVEQDRLYKQFDLKAAWDSPQNKPHSQTVLNVYSDAESPTDSMTRWKVFYDNDAFFDSDPNKPSKITNILDGTSNTIMVVEGGQKSTWSQFNEFKFDPNGPLPQLGRQSNSTDGKFIVVMADGSVRFVRKTVERRILNAAITKAGGEVEASNLTD
jgi:hypothetical protein